jgi:5-methylcytosine-specific restriction protein A
VNLADEHNRKSSGAETVARRYEAKLQKRYEDHLRAKGIDVDRLIIPIRLTKVQLKVDLANFTEKVIIEVKAGTSRGYVREAIGQVLDYMHQMSQSAEWQGWKPAILLPGRPSEDLVGLIASLNIVLIYEDAEGSFK